MYYYSPCLSEVEYNDYSTRQLINRLYKGSAKNLIAAIASHEDFSDAELEELRKMFKVGKKDE